MCAERPVQPTGQTRRFDLAVSETEWELLPGAVTRAVTFGQGETSAVVVLVDKPGAWLLHCHDLHHAANAGSPAG